VSPAACDSYGQTVVQGDAVLGDTQLGQSLALGGEGLGVGAAACVADQSVGHDWGVMDSPPSLRINPYRLFETPLVLAVIATSSPTWGVRLGFPMRTCG
jgi:hypothetical protein